MGIKKLLLSLVIGLLVGCIISVFGSMIGMVTQFRKDYPQVSLFLFLPLGSVIVLSSGSWGAALSGGMNQIFRVQQGRAGILSPLQGFYTAAMSLISHLVGASVGRSAGAMQLGASVSSLFRGLPISRSLLMELGVAAGFAGLFGTPLTATVFALEVFVLGHFTLSYSLPVFLAAMVSFGVTEILGLQHFRAAVTFPTLDLGVSLKSLLLILFFLFLGKVFAASLRYGRMGLVRTGLSPLARMLLLGGSLLLLFFLFPLELYRGSGTDLLDVNFSGDQVQAWDGGVKLVLTVLSLLAGFQGGEVTPLFSIGASLGAYLAPLLDLPVTFVAALGYVTVFGSATSTFFATLVLYAEVFGGWQSPWIFLLFFPLAFWGRSLSIYDQQLERKDLSL